MEYKKIVIGLTVMLMAMACKEKKKQLMVKIYETSAAGKNLEPVNSLAQLTTQELKLNIKLDEKLQTITGFGGAFTESSAYLLNQLSKENRGKIIKAYFSKEGANYSLTRTHMNSCDFSLSNYSYAPVENDLNLDHFSIEEDKSDLIPMIKDAMKVSEDGFKLFASPWTAPPWMKDNKNWVGGKLLPEYNDTWALFFSKYADAYKAEGIDIWGFTVVNEPLGNGDNWESMHFTPEEMTDFVTNYLGPRLKSDGKGDLVILGYDQNRADLKEWVDEMYRDKVSTDFYGGTAIHWYESTFDYFPEELQYAHEKAPNKYLIQTEACVDSEVPKWKDDTWYWSKVATDWGYDWAPEDKKNLHPTYVPVYRYARDLIGCLNNWVDGWVDWNMVLDRQGGPNWFKNWCVAPVIVDPELDEVYFTPLYYTMAHFSKFIRPGARVLKVDKSSTTNLMVTVAENPNGEIAVVVFNPEEIKSSFLLSLKDASVAIEIDAKAIQTIVIPPK